jgi:hypothetical protein
MTNLDKQTTNTAREIQIPENLTNYDRRQVAQIFRKTPRTIERWTRAGILPHCKIGGSVIYPASAIRRFIEERTV